MPKKTPVTRPTEAEKIRTGRRRRRGRVVTKKQICIDLLRRPKGASVRELEKATGWQPHSVRGFLSRAGRGLPNLALTSTKPEGRVRRYRMVGDGG